MIKLINVCKLYKEVCALQNVNLHITRGSYCAIAGASGSGKSTLLHILGGLDAPTQGIYLFENTRVDTLSDAALSDLRGQKIGFIFQSFGLSPDLTALQNAALPLLFRGVPRAERIFLASHALEQVGLADRMQHRPAALSGGQQQRVAIARALCTSPTLLLADEPTGNLDPTSTHEIMALFDALHDAGHTIVLITHDRTVAARAARRFTIENGTLSEDFT